MPTTRRFAVEAALEREKLLRELTTRIHTLPFEDLLLKLKEDIARVLACDRVTIYGLDGRKNELVSRVKDGTEIREIRLPISPLSLAGFVAQRRRPLNVRDVYDPVEMSLLDPELHFDSAWDKRTGYRTRQCLAVPIQREMNLHGVIQALNTKSGKPFTAQHQETIQELATTLGVAFQNQERLNSRTSPHDYLLKAGILHQEQYDQAQTLAQQEGRSVEHVLAAKFKVARAEIARSLSEFYRTDYVGFSESVPPPRELLEKFSVDYLKHHLFVPLRSEEGKVVVALTNPRALTLCDDISRRLGGARLTLKVSTREEILGFIDHFFGAKLDTMRRRDLKDIVKQIEDQRASESAAPAAPKKEEEPAAKPDDEGMVLLVNQLIEQAADKGASDIHIEPRLDGPIHVRFRVDGVCVDHAQLPHEFCRNILARIKIMAGLDIAEHRLPQDGKIRFKDFGARDIELRVATVPTTGNQEDAVLRILAASKPKALGELAMLPENLEPFKKVIEEPYGIILCVGPTGSGKTTTLHSALGHINKPDVKIWTAEDPVEITQAGLRQVQIHAKIGFTFERALRSFLRLDPDVIMIGEMRDVETAGAAIEASLTGHLVMSTLHTNNAPETVVRLLDLGLDPFTFGDSLLAVLAQRLVRSLCSACRKPATPTPEAWDQLRREFGDDARWQALGVKREVAQVAVAKGCERCSGTGYRGRLGVHELLVIDDEIRHLVYRKALSSDLRAAGIKKGMILLKQDGIRKVLLGMTDLNEVRSVCMR
ncbi:MAG: GspE/PulE family protein [Planctomycetes bacterium]|nr:GspE/PulE family protein [Planctomycetota bacterium]